MQKRRPGLLRAAAAAVAAWLLTAAAPAADPASVMIVLDNSGSMAGLIEPTAQQTKVSLVRDSLRKALADVGPQAKVGLAVLGHRGGCRVEVVRTPQPTDIDAIVTPLERFRPLGKGPLAAALRQAAEQLPAGAGARSVVLIHDGPDNCRQDVCEAADELGAAGIVAHVVSLGLEEEDLAGIACVPKVTGGRHFKARSNEEADAAIGEALRAATGVLAGMGLAHAAPSTPWSTSVVPPQPVPATGSTAIHLRALLNPDTEPLGVPLHWTVTPAGDPERVLLDAVAANPTLAVAPGDYAVSVRSDLVSATKTVTVGGDAPITVPVALGAGAVEVRVRAKRSNTPLDDARVIVSAADGAPLAVLEAGKAAMLLPPGRFRIGAELGLVRSDRTVTVAEGRSTEVDITLNVGRLHLTTEGSDGAAPLDTPLFIVMEDNPPYGRREVVRSAARQAEFGLPPGTYYLIARQGGVEARERLAIGSGDVVRRSLGAAVGRLSLSSSGPGGLDDTLVSYSVRRLDDPDQASLWTSRPAPVLHLPAGRYRVEARYGLTNVATEREVEIEAGQTTELPIEHQAARLTVRLAGSASGLADVTWEVRDRTGRVVWASSRVEDAVLVQAGRYTVSAEIRETHEERTVELRPGEARLVEIRTD